MEDDPARCVEPVEPTAVVEERSSLGVPQSVVLDRESQLRVREVHARDEAVRGAQAGSAPRDAAVPGG
ncbi:MAG TPA: hypothetical protein VEZ18_10225, partial [Geodermatophilus sp.]|nr:hypothetical protein [Geodermatophilus sp.]